MDGLKYFYYVSNFRRQLRKLEYKALRGKRVWLRQTNAYTRTVYTVPYAYGTEH